jgi:putative ABC transport system permease protein
MVGWLGSLDRKLLRDFWHMRGQVFAIALVIVGGVATFVMSLSTMDSLKLTQAIFYRDYRFADVFASMKRAPEGLVSRIREIPGVDQVETRVVADVKLQIEGFSDPVTGKLVSVPDGGEPLLNSMYIRQGRAVAPGRDDEVVVGEAFAEAHGFIPGDELDAVINGRLKTLTIVGIGLSPEFIYQLKPGSIFPDFKRYGVMWMARTPLGTAYDMEGAFNDLALALSVDARAEDVVERLDELLAPYGGLGAYGRRDQISHRYLSEEFRGLGQMATIFPVIFIGVAAFLLNVVVTRLVNTQREQAAALKAFGYRNLDIGVHYIKLVVMVVALGVCGGIGVGVWLGKGLGEIYMEYYRFPFLRYELEPAVAVTAALVSLAAAFLGTTYAVWRAAMLPPAVAMRPEPPTKYREALVERMGLKRMLSQPTRMIARHIERDSVKALLSVVGIALACSILMVGRFFGDSVDHIVDVQFGLSQREDLSVAFTEPTSRRALFELESVPGVGYGEAYRSVPVRLGFEHRSYRTAILGLEPGGSLYRLLDSELRPFDVPPEGIVLTDYLGKVLGVSPGDHLAVEVLEGSRPVREVKVAALVSQYIGVSGYMDLGALNRLMKEGNAISGAYLSTDPLRMSGIYEALNGMPRVAGAEVRELAIKNFRETMSEQVLIFAFVNTILAATIAFGVVYNSARIALAERNRELASLRVLGFTRGEISYILLGELGVLTFAAIPLGFLIGNGLCAYIITKMQTDLYRMPLVLEPGTYAFSATVVLVSAALSGLVVRRRLDHLDLVSVLKTKE